MKLVTQLQAAMAQDVDGWRKVWSVNTELYQCTVYSDGTDALVGFYPTKGSIWPPSKDWIRDLMAWFWFWTGLLIHDGFRSEIEEYFDGLFEQLHQMAPGTIYWGGFSKGSAHGILFTWRAMREFKGKRIIGEAFACPRSCSWISALIFNWKLSRAPEVQVERFTISGDPVTREAPVELGYAHVAPEQVVLGPDMWFVGDVKLHDSEKYMAAAQAC